MGVVVAEAVGVCVAVKRAGFVLLLLLTFVSVEVVFWVLVLVLKSE